MCRSYISFCSSPTEYGYFYGIFWMLYIANQFVGNLAAALVLKSDIKTHALFIILAVVGFIGVFLTCFIQDLKEPIYKRSEEENNDETGAMNKIDPLMEVVKLVKDKKTVMMIPLIFYSGICQSFFFGLYPLFICEYSDNVNEDLEIKLVGFFSYLF